MMGKHDQGSAEAEGVRRATGGAAGRGRGGRFSAGRQERGDSAVAAERGSGERVARARQSPRLACRSDVPASQTLHTHLTSKSRQ
jgi:hypothetical protein